MDASVNHLLTQVDEKYNMTLNRLGKSEYVLEASEVKSED
jgi:hypothetical protein